MTAPPWLVDFLDGITVWDALLWVGGLVAAILFIRNKGWRTVVAIARGIINAAQILEAVQGLPKFIERTDATLAGQDERIAEIHHETHTNNGSSIKDAVMRTEEVVNSQVLPTLKALADTDAQLRADLDNTQPKEND